MEDEIIETNEEIQEPEPQPRDIHHLIGLDTYQGMTDAEIEIIINFRANIIAAGLAAESKNAELELSRQTIEEQMEMSRSQAQANFELACGNITFKTVELEEE